MAQQVPRLCLPRIRRVLHFHMAADAVLQPRLHRETKGDGLPETNATCRSDPTVPRLPGDPDAKEQALQHMQSLRGKV